MGNFSQILSETDSTEQSINRVRQKYLGQLFHKTQRNTLCYYSGWLQKTGSQFSNITSITDEDKAGFMTCFHGLDKSQGLDLIIHSPGGSISATESLIHYIRQLFGDNIRVFVPQIAMSGGTILSLIGKEIWMGKHSNLGPIDPQFGDTPAITLINEFDRAYKEICQDPNRIKVWSPILSRIAPTLLTQAQQAIELSLTVATNTLKQGMFRNTQETAAHVAAALTNVQNHKEHNRHIHAQDLKNMGLIIKDLEEDNDLQDAVLSVHHAFMITLANTRVAKIIENHAGEVYARVIAS